jgi:predicted HNH restriction endonuclease
VWIKRLKGETVNSQDDLITVCANCHRMLHRLKGKPEDLDVLRTMLQAH